MDLAALTMLLKIRSAIIHAQSQSHALEVQQLSAITSVKHNRSPAMLCELLKTLEQVSQLNEWWQLQMARSPTMAMQLADAGHLAPHAHATPQTVQGSDLMRFAAAGDATLLIGGDLIVTVCQV